MDGLGKKRGNDVASRLATFNATVLSLPFFLSFVATTKLMSETPNTAASRPIRLPISNSHGRACEPALALASICTPAIPGPLITVNFVRSQKEIHSSISYPLLFITL